MGVSKKLLTPSVVEAVVNKVNQKRMTNSKDLRKLRTILPDPVARAHFLSKEGDLESAILRLSPSAKKPRGGLVGELEAAIDAITGVPWTALEELKRDQEILKKMDNAEALLKSLRKTISS
jgi:ParB family chromosome partitioning protein